MEHTPIRKAQNHAQGLDSPEEPLEADTPDPKFTSPEVVYPKDYGDEADLAFWKDKAVNLESFAGIS